MTQENKIISLCLSIELVFPLIYLKRSTVISPTTRLCGSNKSYHTVLLFLPSARKNLQTVTFCLKQRVHPTIRYVIWRRPPSLIGWKLRSRHLFLVFRSLSFFLSFLWQRLGFPVVFLYHGSFSFHALFFNCAVWPSIIALLFISISLVLPKRFVLRSSKVKICTYCNGGSSYPICRREKHHQCLGLFDTRPTPFWGCFFLDVYECARSTKTEGQRKLDTFFYVAVTNVRRSAVHAQHGLYNSWPSTECNKCTTICGRALIQCAIIWQSLAQGPWLTTTTATV